MKEKEFRDSKSGIICHSSKELNQIWINSVISI